MGCRTGQYDQSASLSTLVIHNAIGNQAFLAVFLLCICCIMFSGCLSVCADVHASGWRHSPVGLPSTSRLVCDVCCSGMLKTKLRQKEKGETSGTTLPC